MRILALSAFHQDAAAALLVDGEPIAIACEARFTRKRGERAFPSASVGLCLERAGVGAPGSGLEGIDYVAFAGKPLAQFERRVESMLALAPRGFRRLRDEITGWLTRDIGCARALDKGLGVRGRRYVFVPQHEALAAAAFLTSRFDECAVLSVDGRNGWTSVSIGRGSGRRVEPLAELPYPHGFDALDAALRAYLSLEEEVDEDELIDLASRGRPLHVDRLHRGLVEAREAGAFHVTRAGFEAASRMSRADALQDLFGTPPRARGAPFDAACADAAAAVRDLTCELLLGMAREARRLTGSARLAAALHMPFASVAWSRVAAEAGFERTHLAPTGSSAALGAALFVEHAILDRERRTRGGVTFARAGISAAGVPARADLDAEFDVGRVVAGLARGERIGLACGRAETGLVAAGARCVLGDARQGSVWAAFAAQSGSQLGGSVRGLCVPFAKAHEWFDVPAQSTSLNAGCVWSVRADKQAVLGGTTSARVLTVAPDRHPELARILDAFERAHGVPLLVHAPLALPGEPPVARIEDARRVFLSSEIDALVLDDVVEEKSARPAQIEARRVVHAHAQPNGEADTGIDALWACPACGGALVRDEVGARCRACNRTFAQEEGIWRLFHPHEPHEGDVTELVKGFYEEHPFPNYDERESVGSLMEKSRRGVYARQLFEQIPFDARVLEVGCGTGQLSNFLGIGCRTVVGTDLCLNSLRLAERFRSGQGLARVRFAQMNLFRPAFAPGSFDVVLCNGVLHHTADPRGGFESIAKLVKPGGLIVIGLYNTYGRLLLDARRVVFRVTGGRFKWIDSYLRTTPMSAEKIDAWFHDQYRHPHESKHTMGEVLEWFRASGFEFVHGVPPTSPWTDYSEDAALFEREEAGNALERAIAQTQMIATGSREGGFFIMIGRKVG